MMNPLGQLFKKHKNNKLWYYSQNSVRLVAPSWIFRLGLKKEWSRLGAYDKEYLRRRVNYYNKLDQCLPLPAEAQTLKKFRLKNKLNTYFFDCYEYVRYFDPELRLKFLFGDVSCTFEEPTVVKSRPLNCDNKNSVLLKLNKIRHFIYTRDRKPFPAKKDMLVFRGGAHKKNRIDFLEKYFRHSLCNVGQTNRGKNPAFYVERMTIEEQLDYKFILCLEGNDVASNLKWVMSSNSLAVMPRPRCETWFMEGTLVPDVHYVEIKDDYSDLEERLRFFMAHPDKAQQIIENANLYVEQFKRAEREKLISLLVLEKYFYLTGQKEIDPEVKDLLQL